MPLYAVETAKRLAEQWTGVAQPPSRELKARVAARRPSITRFRDDGRIPNNPTLAFVRYRGAVDVKGAADPAAVFEMLFEKNGWTGSWRNGIYDYVHYHPRTHEVLGIARGSGRVQFGGPKGKTMMLKAGDVVILPAGTGHRALSTSKDLLVIGAYPARGKYDEYEGSTREHDKALLMIPKVALPSKDPVYGGQGPLRRLWKRRAKKRH
jgi:uncharacterized protein YjlB